MARKTKSTKMAEQVDEFLGQSAEQKTDAPKTKAPAKAKPKSSVAKSRSNGRVSTTTKKASAKTASKAKTTAQKSKTTPTKRKASTAKPKSTRRTSRSKAGKVAPKITGINGTNGTNGTIAHHPVIEPDLAAAILEEPPKSEQNVEAVEAQSMQTTILNFFNLQQLPESLSQTMQGWFPHNQAVEAEPAVAQPNAQAEFAPLQPPVEDEIVEPSIIQPGPQAEFREMAETTPTSAPERQVASDAPPSENTQPAEEPAPAPVEEDLEYVRVIRAMAMIVIVAEHLAFPLIYRYNEILLSEWWIGTSIYLWGKAGSPLFTMVSGLLLLNPSKNNQTLQVFFKKRFMKVLVPFLGWSAIYLLWQIYWVGAEYSARDIMVAVIDGPVYYHLWFIQMILGLYLATPVMRIYTKHATRDNMTYFLIVWFVGTALFPMVRRFYGFNVGIDIYVTVGFMGYFVLGYYLRPLKLNRQQMMICLGVIVAFSLITMWLTHWMVVRANGKFDNFFALNTSFNIMILTTAFFMFMKSLDYKKIYERYTWFKFFITHVASTSFGLYLVHVLIIEDFRSGRPGIQLHGMTWHPAIAIPVLTLATMTVSVLIVKRMQQIPYLRNIVP